MARRLIIMALAIAAFATVSGPASSGAATLRHFDATVISKSSGSRTFKADVQNRGVMRFKVTRSTRFERVAGFGGITRGLELEVTAKRVDGRWVAVEVEISGRDRNRDDGGSGRGRGHDD
jgi:hypothetical protein